MTGLMLPKPCLNALPMGAHSVIAITDEALFETCGVRIAFTSREGGTSTGPYASLNTGDHVEDDLECVLHNRAIVLEAIGFAQAPLIVPNQVHGTDIARVSKASDVPAVAACVKEGIDAVMVETPGVGALLNFADCLPLIVVALDGRFVVAHAGWRGALAGIAGKAVRLLAECGQDAGGFNAYIGPHIHSECFETSEEIARQFADAYGSDVLTDSRHISLARAVMVDLVRAGMSQDRIADAGICTVCNSDRYFSYRAAGGVCGRHAAVAIREEGSLC